MAYPRIIYNGTILDFTYPPTKKAGPHDGNGDRLEAQRSDSITLSGIKQAIWWRTDRIRVFNMEFVPNDDLAAWKEFFNFALTGETWDYYPDADLGDSETFTLEDTQWPPAFSVKGLSSFKFEGRIVVEEV